MQDTLKCDDNDNTSVAVLLVTFMIVLTSIVTVGVTGNRHIVAII